MLCELALPTLDTFCPPPPEGWLEFAYFYARDVMFPQSDFAEQRRKYGAGTTFLLLALRVALEDERERMDFDWRYDVKLLSEQEIASSDAADEYRRLLSALENSFFIELMRLARQATVFCTQDHICGVHYVAMTAARAMHASNVPVDLAIVSGAALAHDVGKFGCKAGERVPYMHYYYTDRWCVARGLPTIGHIAANHSTWDLALENLPVESLLLIYADFRVKQSWENGVETALIMPLNRSFQDRTSVV